MEGYLISRGGHGPDCEDCSWMWETINNKLVVVQGIPKIPKNAIADYWNSLHNTNENHNYNVGNTCVCGSTETLYAIPKNFSLPAHDHIVYDKHGKRMVMNKYGELVEFNK